MQVLLKTHVCLSHCPKHVTMTKLRSSELIFHLCWRGLQKYMTKHMDTGRSEELELLIQQFALLRPLPPLISLVVFPLDFIHISAQTTFQFAMPFGIIKGAFLWKTFNLHLGCLNCLFTSLSCSHLCPM